MKIDRCDWCVLLACLLGGTTALASPATPVAARLSTPAAGQPAPLAGLPVAFVANRGQWDPAAHFRAQAGRLDVWCESNGWSVVVERPRVDAAGLPTDASEGVAVGLRFEGADARALPSGHARQPGARHWLRGDDPAAWVTDVPSYARLRWRELYPGVDVVLRGAGDDVEYDLHLQPGADLDAVVVRCDGVDALELLPSGELLLHTALGPLRQSAPTTFAVGADGALEPVPCRFELRDERSFGFRVPPRHAGRGLWIDPVLEWGTFLGGSHSDAAFDVLVDAAGCATVVGFTQASDYPASSGAFDGSWNGSRDGVVTRLAANGAELVFSTVLGGNKDDEITAVALAPGGGVALAGWTASANFPTSVGAADTTFGGGAGVLGDDAFVACLDASGGQLLLSSYLGGSGDDHAFDLAVAADGALQVVGKTASADFPVTPGAFDTSYAGGSADVGDAFVASLEPDGSGLRWASFLGGVGDDLANALVLADDGALYVAGWSGSADFPVSNGALQASMQGFSDGFVVRLSAGGDALQVSSLLGGASDENVLALGLDDQGRVVLAGTTRSGDFPTTAAAPQPEFGGGVWFGDAFVARLSADLSQLDLASYLGGAGDDVPAALALLADDQVLLAGWTTSADWPLAGETLSAALSGSSDAFVALLDLEASQVLQSTYVGGSASDKATAFALSSSGELVLAGHTSSGDMDVTSGAFDTSFGGLPNLITDGFTQRLDAGLVLGSSLDWVDLGLGHPGSLGTPSLAATGSLDVGGGGGLLLLREALPNAWAQLVLGFDAGYLPLRGGTLVPWPLVAVLGFTSDPTGAADMPYGAAEPGSAGLAFCVQVWIQDAGASHGWAASNGLEAYVP